MRGKSSAVSEGGEWVTGKFDLRAYAACESKDGPIWLYGQNRTVEVRKGSLLFVLLVGVESIDGNVEKLGEVNSSACYTVLGDFEVVGGGPS